MVSAVTSGRLCHACHACTISPTERVDYTGGHLLEADVPDDPVRCSRRWLADAFAARDQGRLAEPTAMVVATSVAGRPQRPDRAAEERRPPRASSSSPTTTRARAPRSRPTRRSPCISAGTRCSARCASRGPPRRWTGPSRRTTSAPARAARSSAPGPRPSPRWSRAGDELAEAYAAAEQRFAGQEVPCPEHWGGFLVDARDGRVLAGPAQPDARPAALHPHRQRLVPDPACALTNMGEPRPPSATPRSPYLLMRRGGIGRSGAVSRSSRIGEAPMPPAVRPRRAAGTGQPSRSGG